MQRATIFDWKGRQISEVNWPWRVNQALNGAGQGTLTVPKNDDIFRELEWQIVKVGNIVLIEDDRCGSWAGFLDTPYDWPPDKISIPLMGYEYKLKYRRTSDAMTAFSGTGGAILKSWLAYTNSKEDTLIDEGMIDLGGPSLSYAIVAELIYDAIRNHLVKDAAYEWWIEPVFDQNRATIRFRLNWQPARGDTFDKVLSQGQHIMEGNILYRQDGPVVNDILGIGNNADPASAPRVWRYDPVSIANLGLRESVLSVASDSQEAVTAATRNALYHSSWLMNYYQPVVQEKDGTDLFSMLKIGDYIRIELLDYGFHAGHLGVSSLVRVIGREWMAESGGEYRHMLMTVAVQDNASG